MKTRLFTLTYTLLLALTVHAQEYSDTNDTDEALLPEGMQLYELDSLLNDWMTRNYLTNVENCLSTGVNPVFDHETYAQRLSRLPNVIAMPYNETVRKYIDRYCERLRPSISIMLGAWKLFGHETNGIDDHQRKPTNGNRSAYDLLGRPVSHHSPLTSHLLISNGKKYIR